CRTGNEQDLPCHRYNLLTRFLFGAQLYDVCASLHKHASHVFGTAARQVSRIDEAVETKVLKLEPRFHLIAYRFSASYFDSSFTRRLNSSKGNIRFTSSRVVPFLDRICRLSWS